MGNKSSSSSSQMPPYLMGSGSGSRNTPRHGSPYCTTFIAQPYAPPAFHQSATSLHHFSGTDSGYLTSPADSERWRAHNWKIGNSRLSLNEAFVIDGPPGPPTTLLPPPPFIPIPPPTLKQFKKWQKKQKKLLKKMGTMPPNIIPPHAQVTPVLPYSRAYSVDNLSSQVLDGYADVPIVQKRSWKECKKVRKNHAFGDAVSEIPLGLPKSTVSSGCSNGFAVSDLRMINSAPSTNTSDRSRLTSTTDRSSSLQHQTPSPVQLKNSSNQHLQRVRMSRNDNGVPGSPRRFHQWNLVTRGEPSSDVQHESVDVIDEETNNEVRKCGINDHSSDMNCGSRRTTTVTEYIHPGAATSHDYDEQRYSHRHGANGSTVRNSRYSGHDASDNDDNNSERIIPIKITPEAKKILEKNAQLFPKSVANPTDDDKLHNPVPGTTSQNYTPQQTQLGYLPLKRSADYGSTVSSLTQSSNMKTEVSDIDFSWVNDVENRLDREIAFVREDSRQQQQQEEIPVRYFGMDLEQSDNGKSDTAIAVSPIHSTATKSLEVFGECESRKELSQIHSDVRSKAAMFDTEAFRNERKFEEQQAATRYRSRSTPRGNVYIPQPDYQSYDPISVDISQNSGRYFGIKSTDAPAATAFKSDQCPQRCSEGSNIKQNGCNTEIGITRDKSCLNKNNNIGKTTKKQQQQYSDHRNEMLQRNRTYDATEYYIQNAARRGAEKSWRTSVAY